MGPMVNIKLRINFISQRCGADNDWSSKRSVGIVSCAESYKKLFKSTCVGSIGRNGRNIDAKAILKTLPKLELVPINKYLSTFAEARRQIGRASCRERV